MDSSPTILVHRLGIVPYQEALEAMETAHAERVEHAENPGVIFVLQHPPTVTMGLRPNESDLLQKPEELKFRGVAYHKIDRGGSVTVHEPGQAVIYPIVRLQQYGWHVRTYIHNLEEAMIQTCAHFGVQAHRHPEYPGVWVGNNKIGAVGVRFANRVTKHGLAFNVTNAMHTFSYVVPCGIRDHGVTNLRRECPTENIGNDVDFYATVEDVLVHTLLQLWRTQTLLPKA